jgi:hypothetical protein
MAQVRLIFLYITIQHTAKASPRFHKPKEKRDELESLELFTVRVPVSVDYSSMLCTAGNIFFITTTTTGSFPFRLGLGNFPTRYPLA